MLRLKRRPLQYDLWFEETEFEDKLPVLKRRPEREPVWYEDPSGGAGFWSEETGLEDKFLVPNRYPDIQTTWYEDSPLERDFSDIHIPGEIWSSTENTYENLEDNSAQSLPDNYIESSKIKKTDNTTTSILASLSSMMNVLNTMSASGELEVLVDQMREVIMKMMEQLKKQYHITEPEIRGDLKSLINEDGTLFRWEKEAVDVADFGRAMTEARTFPSDPILDGQTHPKGGDGQFNEDIQPYTFTIEDALINNAHYTLNQIRLDDDDKQNIGQTYETYTLYSPEEDFYDLAASASSKETKGHQSSETLNTVPHSSDFFTKAPHGRNGPQKKETPRKIYKEWINGSFDKDNV